MLYTVFLAICIAGTPVVQCNGTTARDWIVAPEPQQGLSACAIHGQQYAAQSRLLHTGDMLKIFCRPVVRERGVI